MTDDKTNDDTPPPVNDEQPLDTPQDVADDAKADAAVSEAETKAEAPASEVDETEVAATGDALADSTSIDVEATKAKKTDDAKAKKAAKAKVASGSAAQTPEEKARAEKAASRPSNVDGRGVASWQPHRSYRKGDLVRVRFVLYSASDDVAKGIDPSSKQGADSWQQLGTRAVARYLRFSAQKGRLVADMIRGKRVAEAVTLLAFSERAAAREVYKVLWSALHNAQNNHGLSADDLWVQGVLVDEGPTFKRYKPRARGRADRINKRTCHVTVVVEPAPAELLAGRAGRGGAKADTSRSARVAASKAADTKPVKKDTASKKASAKKDAGAKAAANTEGDA